MSDQLRPCPAGHDSAQILVRDGRAPNGDDTQIYHVACPKCGWKTEDCYRPAGHRQAMELWNNRPAEDELVIARDIAQRQAAAMRGALVQYARISECQQSVDPEPDDRLACAACGCVTADHASDCPVGVALRDDAGREYVPRAALDTEREKVAKLRELLAKYAVRYEHEYPPICTACYHVGPGHYRDCEINRVLAETEVNA